MRRSLIASLLVVCAAQACADGTPMESDRVRTVLREMENASTWYHDDLFGEFAGFQYYARHRYADALHYFKLGAYYADKPAQVSIGMMYLNGEGVCQDRAMAFAWIELAAERGYPAYVATRERVKTTLSEAELMRAEALYKEISDAYGDAVAKPRLAAQLRAGLRLMTGSRAGFDSGVKFLSLEAIDPAHASTAETLAATTVCTNRFWAAQCWQPELYFAMRDRQLNATVTVGSAEQQR